MDFPATTVGLLRLKLVAIGNRPSSQLRITRSKLADFSPSFRSMDSDFRNRSLPKKIIVKHSIIIIGLVLLLSRDAFAGEKSLLARITVYWHSKGPQQRACFSGVRLRPGHCAVDPRRIAYGSRVLFADKVCVAVDTGPDVISRKAARSIGRTVSERNAVVIDRFFDSREQALAWARTHPHFMTVRVVTPDKRSKQNLALNGEQSRPISAAVIF
jgi:3D (Asp-Asp-Asp) domain-containing protein